MKIGLGIPIFISLAGLEDMEQVGIVKVVKVSKSRKQILKFSFETKTNKNIFLLALAL